jgi:hypothetical protein
VVIALYLLLWPEWHCGGRPIQIWLIGILCAYVLDAIAIIPNLSYVRIHARESPKVTIIRYLILAFVVGWNIWGNIIYYDGPIYIPATCSNIAFMMFLMIILGYIEMLKFCCLSMVICIIVPILIRGPQPQQPNA